MSIDSTVVDEIRARIDIVDVVSQYVSLKRMGNRYKGLCPFHAEKTPSFSVNPEMQIYKCFGCGAAGDVFTFVMSQTQQNFGEVVRELARQCGVRIVEKQEDTGVEQWRVKLRKINQEASLFFQWQLKHPQYGEVPRQYLLERGIDVHTQQRFALGYAPDSWHQLFDQLKSKGFEPEELDKSGLFKRSEKGLYDIFRHRVIFPIVSVNGDVLGFGGRTLESDNPAKYINSPETDIYVKGQHIYGLNLAKKAIKEKDRVILMEGYLDVISAHQHGFDESVAALGTALTTQQTRQLMRFSESKTIILAYDADSAGQKAADKAAEVFEQSAQGIPIRLHVLQLPDKEDPDTFLRQFGQAAFEDRLKQAPAYTAYFLDKILQTYQLDNPVDKAMAAQAGVKALLKMADPVLRDEYLRFLADRLGIDESALREQLQQSNKQNKRKLSQNTQRNQRQSFQKKNFDSGNDTDVQAPRPEPLPLKDVEFISELGLMYCLLKYPEQRDQVLAHLREHLFFDSQNEDLRQYLVSMAEAELDLSWTDLFIAFPEPSMHQRLSEMMENTAFQSLDLEKSLADFGRNVKLKCLERDRELLDYQIQLAEQNKDQTQINQLMQKYLELMQKMTRLKQTGHQLQT